MKGTARATPHSSKLLIQEPEVPALVDGIYITSFTYSCLLICQSQYINGKPSMGREEIHT
jgi:hypothetical protein